MKTTEHTLELARENDDGTETIVTCFYSLSYERNVRRADEVTSDYSEDGELADGTTVPLNELEIEEIAIYADDRKREAQGEANDHAEAAAEAEDDFQNDR